MRERLTAAFDRFIDMQDKTDSEIVQFARDLEIDIAIDLGGYTQDARIEIFAQRIAPIQINYLGYPATSGASFIDYVIGDPVLIPPECERFYSEKIVRMPHSFQVNDTKRAISNKSMSRQTFGLPEHAFVFCCFNNNYKITPAIFDSWMNILSQTDDSVLWLLKNNSLVATNLRKEAEKRGIDADRLIFGGSLPHDEYLARYRHADLFLDTTPFNAGTTASDALWAGLPLITVSGEGFASRMAASLLHAIDLPELVTDTHHAYEALAVELAGNPVRMTEIRQRLAANRTVKPLFDTPLFARHIEAAYTEMHARHLQDLPPDHILVKP
jgi:predicted O-linked N-acetylglucosamine transferase (SPINDLY family)